MPRIAHLIDDTTAGGVMRVLGHIQACPQMSALGTHRIIAVPRDGTAAAPIDAEVLVSHLSLSWRRLPWFVSLRAVHAHLPMIHVEHSYTEAYAGLNVIRRARFRTLLATAYSLFDRVVAVSASQGAWLADRGLVAAENLAVIPSTVDLAPFLALPPAPEDTRVIGAMGRLEPQKGFDTLIAALRGCRARDIELHIFGEGAERARLQAQAAGDPRIRFRGWVEPHVAMAEVDAVAMPSRWEAYGLVALEARAAGRPLLAAPVDGLKDHIADGALEVAGRGVAAWTTALEMLAGQHDDVRCARARKAAATAPDRFAAGWAELLRGLEDTRDVSRAA
jgi:D-inositol-3-phosphate glycosyltransferase